MNSLVFYVTSIGSLILIALLGAITVEALFYL
jgi:hypothetical protein